MLVSVFISAPTAYAQAGFDLMQAAYSGDLNKLKAILDSDVDINMRDSSDSTPLMLAVSRGHMQVVRELLAHGADINLQNSYGWTPLMLAKANHHAEIVSLLISHNLNPLVADQQHGALTVPTNNAGSAETIAGVNAKKPVIEQIDELLKTAGNHMSSLRLTLPPDDNAYTTYLRVLELDPQNLDAKAGVQKIATFYESRARERLTNGAIRSSLKAAKRGLSIFPNHSGLLEVQSAAYASLTAQKVRQRRIAPAQKVLRKKVEALNQIEKKQIEEELAIRQSMQKLLQSTLSSKEK